MSSLGPVADTGFDYRAANLSAALSVRIAQVSLTIMAVSVTTALICRFGSGWSLTFGLVVIGALIVPSNDIVRFILLITGSERAYSELYRHETPQRIRIDYNPEHSDTDKSDQNECELNLIDDVIVYRIADLLSDAGIEGYEDVIQQVVSREVIRYTARELIANVVARGASETFASVATNDAVAFQTAFQGNEQAKEHMLYLRSEGLVDFPFDHFHLARMTDFGTIVFLGTASKAERDRERDRLSSEEAACAEQLARGAGFLPTPLPTPPPVDSIVDLSSVAGGRVTAPAGGYSWLKFSVETPAEYSMLVRAGAGDGDPYLYLFDGEGFMLEQNDDGGHAVAGFASLIVRSLEPGTLCPGSERYHPAKGDLSGGGGHAGCLSGF